MPQAYPPRTVVIAVPLLVVAVLSIAAPADAARITTAYVRENGGNVGDPCADSYECYADLACYRGKCAKPWLDYACDTRSECINDRQVCRDGMCVDMRETRAPCEANDQCASGTCADGLCAPLGVGAACDATIGANPCAAGHFCSGATQTCAAQIPLGGSCAAEVEAWFDGTSTFYSFSDVCVTGLVCDGAHFEQTCESALLGKEGDACGPSHYSGCNANAGLKCVWDDYALSSGTCKLGLGAGAPCNHSNVCASSYACVETSADTGSVGVCTRVTSALDCGAPQTSLLLCAVSQDCSISSMINVGSPQFSAERTAYAGCQRNCAIQRSTWQCCLGKDTTLFTPSSGATCTESDDDDDTDSSAGHVSPLVAVLAGGAAAALFML